MRCCAARRRARPPTPLRAELHQPAQVHVELRGPSTVPLQRRHSSAKADVAEETGSAPPCSLGLLLLLAAAAALSSSALLDDSAVEAAEAVVKPRSDTLMLRSRPPRSSGGGSTRSGSTGAEPSREPKRSEPVASSSEPVARCGEMRCDRGRCGGDVW